MYLRLDAISRQLEWVGSRHESNRWMMMRRLADRSEVNTEMRVVNLLEPVKGYKRNAKDALTKFYPYSEMADIAIADPKSLRDFNIQIDSFVRSTSPSRSASLDEMAFQWKIDAREIKKNAVDHPRLEPLAYHARQLDKLADLIIEGNGFLRAHMHPSGAWKQKAKQTFDGASAAHGSCELGVAKELLRWLDAL
jgi:hexosaminidase